MREITVAELKKMIDDGVQFQLVDVREPHEYETGNIGGELIPLGSVFDNTDRIKKDQLVIVHCRSGARSAAAIRELEQHFGFSNLANLKGGIIAWAREIDPSVSTG